MSREIVFAKMHGLGNDFVIIDAELLPTKYDLEKLALIVADRHLGLGCDQFIVYQKYHDYYEMQVYNQDGSRALACGNAVRCLAKLLYINSNKENIDIKIAGRKITAQVLASNQIMVNMGAVSFNEQWMPTSEEIWHVAERYMFDPKEMICADIGNPHLVIFSHLNSQDQEVVGKMLQEHELFPDGINVDFAYIKDNKIYLSVWERGAGFTLACGSGACVSFAAAVKLGFMDAAAEVVFKYGSLSMSRNETDIIMTGSATLVAIGKYYYEYTS
ncbi:Diaminopimelate epimerase [Candidatus Trichorickettsia mobilis]|uniref:Diaminopimelate epimerase n=1 Tax=Candidatus Trichorickettsia mobilis TaxID=1346319 RepID=A0ABZ0UYQ2_9RICK|nr:diaminopimelate epimerase [Candidatus Trichorickettsia mobilis]WPY01199.1 Diaminopimelate epimerase [Candidatus Trichorickettsia mobilis]